MMPHVNRCASYLPLSLFTSCIKYETWFLTIRAMSALNSSRGGDCHMYETPRSKECARARPQICKYHSESLASPHAPGKAVIRGRLENEKMTPPGSLKSWRSLVTTANCRGPRSTLAVWREIFSMEMRSWTGKGCGRSRSCDESSYASSAARDG
jgi:hypothetical protein